MRFAALCLAMGYVAAANASFDLMLLPSSDGKIYRYDPANQVHLGSFGTGGTINATAANPVNGEVAVIREGQASMGYDSSTGALKWASSAGGATSWLGYNSSLNRYDVLAADRYLDTISSNEYVFGPQLAPFTLYQNYIRYDGGSGLAFGIGLASGIVTFARWTGGVILQSSNTTNAAGTTTLSNLLEHDGETYLIGGTGSSFIFSQVIDATGTATSVATANLLNGGLANFDAAQRVYLVKSHTGFYAVGKSSGSANWRVNELINLSANNWYKAGGFETNVAYSAALPSIILAPEPGTMIALGAGLAAILKRRKRSAVSG